MCTRQQRYGPVTHSGKALFKGTCTVRHTGCTATFTLHLSHASRRWDLALSSSPFVRHYSGNPFWFLFLRLFICLNSAGNLVWSEVDKISYVVTRTTRLCFSTDQQYLCIYITLTCNSRAESAAATGSVAADSRFYAVQDRQAKCWLINHAKHLMLDESIATSACLSMCEPWYVSILFRPSDRRTFGKDPKVQCAFENLVFGVSCNSHRLSELALFFIDLWAEWSTVNSCTLTLWLNQLALDTHSVRSAKKCFYTFKDI